MRHGSTSWAVCRYNASGLRSLARSSIVEDLFESAFAHRSGLDPIEAAMAVDDESYLPDDLLVKIDIATMAYGWRLVRHSWTRKSSSFLPAFCILEGSRS